MEKLIKHLNRPLYALCILFISLAFKSQDNYFEINKNLEQFNAYYRQVNHLYHEEIAPGALMQVGIKAMSNYLDPYTVFYPESVIEESMLQYVSGQEALPFTIQTWQDKHYVDALNDDSLRFYNIIKLGDELISLNGKPIHQFQSEEIESIISKLNDGNEIIIVRDKDTLQQTFKKNALKIKDVIYQGLLTEEGNKVAYLKFRSFTNTCGTAVANHFASYLDSNINAFVLDLRGNPGGLLSEAVKIVNLFIPQNQLVVSMKGKHSKSENTWYTKAPAMDDQTPVFILIDENSASASEIVSGTLQDYDRAVIIGSPSFGKGLVQQTRDLPYHSKMKVTIAKYYTASGRCVQKIHHKAGAKLTYQNSEVFKTKNGRTVKSYSGVIPEIELDQKLSEFGKQLVETPLFMTFVAQLNNFESINTETAVLMHQFYEQHHFKFDSPEQKAWDLLRDNKEINSSIETSIQTAHYSVYDIQKEIQANWPWILLKLKNAYLNKEFGATQGLKKSLAFDPCMQEVWNCIKNNQYNSILNNK